MRPLRPFPSSARPLVFAHRGLSSLYPENSLAAFQAAVDIGCPGIELDIHLCASGELVVFHDDTTSRITGVDGRVEEMDLAALKKLDIGSWMDPRFSAERILTLDELFSHMGTSVYWDIEIKCRVKEDTGIASALSALIDAHGLADRVAASSFNPFPLKYLKALRKDIPTAIIWCADKELPWVLRGGLGAWMGGVDYLKPDYRVLGQPSVYCLGAGLRRDTVAWTVDDAETARLLLDRGVKGIITNRPQDLG